MSKGIATIADVAQKAGVSKGAAWAVLSGKKCSIRVSEKIRKRINQVVTELNYKPNILAKSLATNRSFLIAMIIRKDLYFKTMPMLEEIQNVLREHNYSLVVYMCDNTLKEEMKALELCRERKVDGILIQPNLDGAGGTNLAAVQQLQRQGIKVVQIFNSILEGVIAVRGDYHAMSYDAVNIMRGLGRSKIGYLTYRFSDLRGSERGAVEAIEKSRGYAAAMADHGLEERFVTYPMLPNLRSIDKVYRTADDILAQIEGLDSVIAFSNSGAYGLLKILEENKIKVPETIAVMGMSVDVYPPIPFMPALGYYAQDLDEVAREVALLCLSYLESKCEYRVEDVYVKPVFFRGETL